MNIYRRKQIWKTILLCTALIIGGASLWYTNKLVRKLSNEEKKRVELWAKATNEFGKIADNNIDISFLSEVIQNNTTIPVILSDDKDKIISFRNLDSIKSTNPDFLIEQLKIMRNANHRIEIDLGNGRKNYIYRSEEHTSELQSLRHLVCRLLLEKK